MFEHGFKLSAVTDEVSQDFAHALAVIDTFGIRHVELRTLWDKNIVSLSDEEAKSARALLQDRGMHPILIDGPIFKCDIDKNNPTDYEDVFFQERLDYAGHLALLERAIELAHFFETPMVRVFSFWRQSNAWERMVERFQPPLEMAAAAGLSLVLENIGECNVATSTEVVRFFNLVQSPHIGLIWDPGNAYWAGEENPVANGYESVKTHISHVHVKDLIRTTGPEEVSTRPIGQGEIDYTEQFRALAQDGYQGFLSLEPEYVPHDGTQELGTQQSWDGLRSILAALSMQTSNHRRGDTN